jgi:hypothetical protein
MEIMAKNISTAYRFRVSDAVQVPLRGMLLRLKLVDGTPDLESLEPGETIQLVAPDGGTRTAEVKALSLTGGNASQRGLDRYRQLDLVIGPDGAGEPPVGIGWHVVG